MATTLSSPHILTSTSIMGDPVNNAAGESLGEIQDLMVELATGRVIYAVLSFGGFLGLGNKLYAVPWSALRAAPEDEGFILDVSRERLEQAPGFDKNSWPDMADSEWAKGIHGYYGINPYWE